MSEIERQQVTKVRGSLRVSFLFDHTVELVYDKDVYTNVMLNKENCLMDIL
jgi:hypothetical protein